MFTEVLPPETLKAVRCIAPKIPGFYLAGGTGLALQIGHRLSNDLDFFTPNDMVPEHLIDAIHPTRILLVQKGTLHCEWNRVKLSFFQYGPPLLRPPIPWEGTTLAHTDDLAAEKLKAIAQRGAKKDFFDLYALFKMGYDIETICRLFWKRFSNYGANAYHVIKSLIFFEDAEQEPDPVVKWSDPDFTWQEVKHHFVTHLDAFERHLVRLSSR